MARRVRRMMRQGVADLLNEAAVDAYIGPYGEIIVTPKGIRVHDGVTRGGIRISGEQFLGSTMLTLPSGVTGALAALLGLATDFLISPAAGETVVVPAGVSSVVVRGGVDHFRLVLPPMTADGRLLISVEEGTQQSRPIVQCVPAGADTITDGFIPVGQVPISIQFERVANLVRTAGVWTIGDPSSPSPVFRADLVNSEFRYGFLSPPTARTQAQTITFTVGAGATNIGADGVCRDAPAGTLRETYDPVTKGYLGVTFEAFEGRNWFPNATNPAGFAVITNAVGSPALSNDVPPHYTNTATGQSAPVYKLTPDSGNTYCGAIAVDVPPNDRVCVPIMVWIPAQCSGTLSNIFQIQNVTAPLTNSVIVPAVFDQRDCWQRIYCVVQNPTAGTLTSQVRFIASGIRSPGDAQYPNRDLYVTCPQIERSVDCPSSFIPNATGNVPAIRAADTVAFVAGQLLDTSLGFTIVAEMVAPPLSGSGPSGGVGLGSAAAGSLPIGGITAARLRPYGDTVQPYGEGLLTGRGSATGSATVARFAGSPVTPGRPVRLAMAVSANDIVLEDNGGGRIRQTVGGVPDAMGGALLIDAATGPLIFRAMEVYGG